MAELIVRLARTVADGRGTFQPVVMARECADGWEVWLEFVPVESASTTRPSTGIESHQRERSQVERWASGLTQVYAEGALARARGRHVDAPTPVLLVALQEVIDALDRRVPHFERAGEARIAADAQRLRASAIERLESLRPPPSTLTDW